MPTIVCNVQMGSRASAGAAYTADVQLGTRPSANSAYPSNVWLGPKYDPYAYPALGNLVYIQVEDIIGKTENWLDANPNWSSISLPGSSGVAYRLRADPWAISEAGSTAAWLACENGIWRTANINAGAPVWTQKLSKAAFATATGKTLAAFRNVKGTPAQAGVFYAQALATDDTLYICSTFTNGETWTITFAGWIASLIAASTAVPFGFDVSKHDPLKVWTCAEVGVLKGSVDGGETFSTLFTVPFPVGPINNIEVPYEDNADDSIIYISADQDAWIGLPVYIIGTVEIVAVEEHSFAEIDYYEGSPVINMGNIDTAGGWHWAVFKFTIVTPGEDFEEGRIAFDVCRYAGSSNTLNQAKAMQSFAPYTPSLTSNTSSIAVNACPTITTRRGTLGARAYDVGYFKIEWGFNMAISYRISAFRYERAVGSPLVFVPIDWINTTYIRKSVDGASTFSLVTPSEGGASAFCSLRTSIQDKQTVCALVRETSDEEHHTVASADGAGSWAEKSDFNSIAPADADGQGSLELWPHDADTLYALQHRDPGGSPADMIRGSVNQGGAWASKVGDWAAEVQGTWGLTKSYAGSIMPIYRA